MRKFLSDFPEIAKTLYSGDPTKIPYKSNKTYPWLCEFGHTYVSRVASRTNGSGCSICGDKIVLPGFNDMWSTNPRLAERLVNPMLGYRYTESSGAKLVWWCGWGHPHTFKSKVSSVCNGTVCTVCRGKQVDTSNDLWSIPDLAIRLLDQTDGYKYTVGSSKIIPWLCDKGHIEYKSPGAMRRTVDYGCSKCSTRFASGEYNLWITHRYYAEELVEYSVGFEVTSGSASPVWWRCRKNPTHLWEVSPNQRFGHGTITNCPECYGGVSLSEIELRESIPYLTESQVRFDFVFEDKLRRFYPDILVPELCLIIEYDGYRWHSEEGSILWDTSKTKELLRLGYKVVRFREQRNSYQKLPYLPIDDENLLQLRGQYLKNRSHINLIWPQIESWLNENSSYRSRRNDRSIHY